MIEKRQLKEKELERLTGKRKIITEKEKERLIKPSHVLQYNHVNYPTLSSQSPLLHYPTLSVH